jgi:hypothetical protein
MNIRRLAIFSSLVFSVSLCAGAAFAVSKDPPPRPSFSGTRQYQQYQSGSKPVPSNQPLKNHLAPSSVPGKPSQGRLNVQKGGKQNIATPNFNAQAGQKGVVAVPPPRKSKTKTEAATAAVDKPTPLGGPKLPSAKQSR